MERVSRGTGQYSFIDAYYNVSLSGTLGKSHTKCHRLMYSETSKPKTKESQKCHGRVRNLKILSKVLQTRLDKCVKKKASRKVQKHSDCYICFQYL